MLKVFVKSDHLAVLRWMCDDCSGRGGDVEPDHTNECYVTGNCGVNCPEETWFQCEYCGGNGYFEKEEEV